MQRTVLIEQPWNLAIGNNSSIGDRAIIYCLGPITIGHKQHIGAIRGLIQTRRHLGEWKATLMRNPQEVAEAFVDLTRTPG